MYILLETTWKPNQGKYIFLELLGIIRSNYKSPPRILNAASTNELYL